MKSLASVAFSFVILVAAALPEPVMAQPSRVVCESNGGRMTRCAIDTTGRVRLNRQLSDVSCNGRWSVGRGYVEVKDGCRGEFVADGDYNNGGGGGGGGGGDRVTCESNNGRTNRCNINTNGKVRLVRQLSDQTCYGNWTVGRGYVEVRNGCRGEFASDGYSGGGGGGWNGGGSGGSWGNQRVICESRDGGVNRCPINTRNQVKLERRLSPRSCHDNWRTGDGYVEVRNGCSGEFVSY